VKEEKVNQMLRVQTPSTIFGVDSEFLASASRHGFRSTVFEKYKPGEEHKMPSTVSHFFDKRHQISVTRPMYKAGSSDRRKEEEQALMYNVGEIKEERGVFLSHRLNST